MTDAAGAADVSVARTPPAVLEYPSTFEATQHPEADLVLRHRSRPAGFRPNLVLTSVETPASLTDASMVAMRAATVQHPGAQLISCDTWDAADAESTPRARRIRFAYHADDRLDVLVSKWVWATGHHHVHLSASCLPSQAGEFEPVFAWVAARLRPTAPPADVLRAAESVGEAAIEGTLTETVGFPLEDLRQLDPVRFRSRGESYDLGVLAATVRGNSSRDGRPLAVREVELLAYFGRAGEPCSACGRRIESAHLGRDRRATYWCPRCQPADGRAPAAPAGGGAARTGEPG